VALIVKIGLASSLPRKAGVSAASASPPQFLTKVFSCTSATFNNLEKRLFWNGPRSIPSVVVMSMWLKPQEFVLERNSITAAASRSRFAPRFWAAWVLHRNSSLEPCKMISAVHFCRREPGVKSARWQELGGTPGVVFINFNNFHLVLQRGSLRSFLVDGQNEFSLQIEVSGTTSPQPFRRSLGP